MPKQTKTPSPNPSVAPTSPDTTEKKPEVVEELSEHRVLISDIADPINPRVVPIVIVAGSHEAAVKTVNELRDPFNDPLKPGCYRGGCRLEEVLPFARDGFGIRRSTWQLTEVALVHPGINTRIDLYIRNPTQPHFAPSHVRELDKLAGPDLLSEDWSVCARPPNFGNRRHR